MTTGSEEKVYKTNLAFYLALLIGGIVLIIAIFLLSLCVGNYKTSLADIFMALSHPDEYPQIINIIKLSRLPRLLGAILVGAALSVAGVTYQEIFSNRMASPDILGVSAGASVGASISIYFGLSFALTGLFAFIGGVIAVFLTVVTSLLFHNLNKQSVALIIAGIVVGGLMNSTLGLFKYLSNDTQIASITFWLLGGFYNTTYPQLYIAGPIIIVCIVVLILFRWKIMLLRNGDNDASIHGVNAKCLRYVVIALATIITSLSICISGTIGWIGLAVPNLIRLLIKNDGKRLMPLSLVYGILLTMCSDLLARTLTNTEIPVGIITGVLGAIIFVIVLILNSKRRHSDD